jgi:hypothetical protein
MDITMTIYQEVRVNLKLTLCLDARLEEEEIGVYVRSGIYDGFPDQLKLVKDNQLLDVLEIREEAEIYGTEDKLPADPDGKNDARAQWASAAFTAFMEATGTDLEDAPIDLICDIMHWCDRNSMDFSTVMERARMHYHAETAADNEAARLQEDMRRIKQRNRLSPHSFSNPKE